MVLFYGVILTLFCAMCCNISRQSPWFCVEITVLREVENTFLIVVSIRHHRIGWPTATFLSQKPGARLRLRSPLAPLSVNNILYCSRAAAASHTTTIIILTHYAQGKWEKQQEESGRCSWCRTNLSQVEKVVQDHNYMGQFVRFVGVYFQEHLVEEHRIKMAGWCAR